MTPPPIPLDREGFRRLFETHRDAMYRFLTRLTRDTQHAEDLLQETFATLWRKREQYRGEGSLEGYVRQIAYRTWINARPRLAKSRTSPLTDATPAAMSVTPDEAIETRLDGEARRREVRAAVDALPDGWREPFVLFRYEGLTCAEIGETLALSPKAVELRLARALRDVARRLGVSLPANPRRQRAVGS